MKTTVMTGLLALAMAAPAWAHHSISAEFDSNRPVTFTGVVTKIEWTNPHIYTHVEAKGPDGKVVDAGWKGAPNALYRRLAQGHEARRHRDGERLRAKMPPHEHQGRTSRPPTASASSPTAAVACRPPPPVTPCNPEQAAAP
jgi:hypothetical protein